ncbi:nitrite/sulfite reductase, partial [Micrococcus aloeverae]
PPTRPGDHVGVHEQKDGRFYIGAAPVVGRSSGTTLTALADLLEAHGSTRLRTTPHQKIVVLDVERDRVDAVVAGLKELGLNPEPSVFRRSTIACTGLEFCKLAIVDTKDTATAAIAQLEERLADLADRLPERLSLHVNGCPNSCARIQTADIGLKGQLLPDDDGGQTPGFQVHLGGGLASVDRAEAGLGRSVRGLKVRADGLVDYVERLVRRYDEQREPGETFARWAHRVDEEALR